MKKIYIIYIGFLVGLCSSSIYADSDCTRGSGIIPSGTCVYSKICGYQFTGARWNPSPNGSGGCLYSYPNYTCTAGTVLQIGNSNLATVATCGGNNGCLVPYVATYASPGWCDYGNIPPGFICQQPGGWQLSGPADNATAICPASS